VQTRFAKAGICLPRVLHATSVWTTDRLPYGFARHGFLERLRYIISGSRDIALVRSRLVINILLKSLS
jgi:hypothetical protein